MNPYLKLKEGNQLIQLRFFMRPPNEQPVERTGFFVAQSMSASRLPTRHWTYSTVEMAKRRVAPKPSQPLFRRAPFGFVDALDCLVGDVDAVGG